MQHRMRQREHPPTDQDTWHWKSWHPRVCGRRAVALRVDYATSDGRTWLGLVRNLSLQGMFIDSALRHVTHEVAPGNLLTVAFVLPSGRSCKVRGMVIHGDGRGCGVQFLEGHPHAFAHLDRRAHLTRKLRFCLTLYSTACYTAVNANINMAGETTYGASSDTKRAQAWRETNKVPQLRQY